MLNHPWSIILFLHHNMFLYLLLYLCRQSFHFFFYSYCTCCTYTFVDTFLLLLLLMFPSNNLLLFHLHKLLLPCVPDVYVKSSTSPLECCCYLILLFHFFLLLHHYLLLLLLLNNYNFAFQLHILFLLLLRFIV